MAFEQVQTLIEHVGQIQFADEHLESTKPRTMHAAGLVAHLVVNVAVLEHAAALLGPLLLAESVLNPALAITQPALYLGFHLKYLRVRGSGIGVHHPLSQKTRGISSFFPRRNRFAAGDTLVLGLVTGILPRDPATGPRCPEKSFSTESRAIPRRTGPWEPGVAQVGPVGFQISSPHAGMSSFQTGCHEVGSGGYVRSGGESSDE